MSEAHAAGGDTGEAHVGPEVSRKDFIDWMLVLTSCGLVGAVGYPVLRYLVPPAVGETTVGSVTLPLKPAELAANSGVIFKFGNKPGILIRTPGGELRAFTAVCTHLGCTVQYRQDLEHIWCACHNGHYDLNGRNIGGPPPRPLEAYNVVVHGDQIVVSRKA